MKIEHMNGLNDMVNLCLKVCCVKSQVESDLSAFKSVELTHGCVMVQVVFESQDSPGHSFRSMYRVSWDVALKRYAINQ